jgi:hypothetical protein
VTRREWMIEWLDDYVVNLRILSQRHLGADRIEDQPTLLALDWRTVQWYDSLWLFELEGIKASGYPGVLDAGSAAEYVTPAQFGEFASRVASSAADRTAWSMEWRQLPISTIELDPRCIAFRTIHDWIILSARVLADKGDCLEDGEGGADDAPAEERRDPFTIPIQTEDGDGEPVGLLCGNLRERLVGGRGSNRWDPTYAVPEWREVQWPWEALLYFHYRGLLLPRELQFGPLRRQDDPRIVNFELLRPESFAAYVAKVIVKDDLALSQSWRDRSAEEVQNDPRFVAHKCGFDTQIILHISREAMRGRKPVIDGEPELELLVDEAESVSDVQAAAEDYLVEGEP